MTVTTPRMMFANVVPPPNDRHTLHVQIVGTAPLIMDRYSDDAAAKGAAKSRKVNRGDDDPVWEKARLTAYLTEDGRLYLPGSNFLACVVEAGRFFKLGKRQLTTAKSSQLTGMLKCRTECAIIAGDDWRPDERAIVNSSDNRVAKVRARIDQWTCAFELEVNTEEIPLQLVIDVIAKAGTSVGLGSMRPARKGTYGTFRVASWQVDDPDADEPATDPAPSKSSTRKRAKK